MLKTFCAQFVYHFALEQLQNDRTRGMVDFHAAILDLGNRQLARIFTFVAPNFFDLAL